MEERFVYHFLCGGEIWRFSKTPLQRQNDLFILSAVKCKFGDFSKLHFNGRTTYLFIIFSVEWRFGDF
jgi:hypothetical protein